MAAVAMLVVVNMLLFRFLGLFTTFVDDFDVIIEDSGDDWNHVGFDDPGTNILCTSNANINHALESEIPFPHAHHILTATLLEDADKSFDAPIDGEDVTDTC